MKLKTTFGLLFMLVIVMLMAQDPTVWPENGIPIRQGENIEWSRSAATLTNGNVVYVWSDTRLGDRDVWAQCVDTNGNNLWNNGDPVIIDDKVNRQEDPVCINTTDGGAIIAWVDFTHSDAGDIYAQKVDANGGLLWIDGGIPLCLAPGIQISLNIVRDDNGGAYIIWID
ncbi:MAG: hypothetical protein K8S56_06130, partial [Candidatus Cloacimonetes bacterium]|nr:hypothetical protein [Candidatus Cloacimonadota bacterium]